MAPRKPGQAASWEVDAGSPKPQGETRARRSYAVKELVTSESSRRPGSLLTRDVRVREGYAQQKWIDECAMIQMRSNQGDETESIVGWRISKYPAMR